MITEAGLTLSFIPRVPWKALTNPRKIGPEPGGASSCNFWTSTINCIFYFIIGILRLRAINWYINEFNRRRSGGGGDGGFRLFGASPPEFYWGIFSKLQLFIWIPQLKASRLAPFLSKLGKRGGLWTFSKVGGTRTRCRPQGESSQ
jgi:hypothetical protein